MDNFLTYKLVEETRQQCRFAQFAVQNLRSSLQALDSEKVFFYVHALLSHAINVSRLFWPLRAESAARGERLRVELKVRDDSPLRLPGWREQVERPDERLEDWIANLENRNYVDMNVMPQGTIAGYKPDSFQRSLDPENFRLHVRGLECDLRQVADELRKVDAVAQTWLRTHQPW